jgi:hypothetical protein
MSLSPIEKILLAREYRVPAWLREGAASLAESFGDHKINDIGTQIGWRATALILLARGLYRAEVGGKCSPRRISWEVLVLWGRASKTE